MPGGLVAIGAGLGISGLTAYVFLAIASHELTPAEYAPLAAFWSLTFLVGPGSFGILERETSRRVAVGLENGPGHQRQLTDIYAFAGIELVFFAVLLTLGHETISQHLFDGNGWLVLAAAVAVPSIGVQYLAWGLLAGNRAFFAYGAMNALEGLLRLAIGVAVVVLGVRTASAFGFAIAVAPAASVIFVLGALRRGERRGASVKAAVGLRTSLWLLGASLEQAFLVNAGPLLVKLLAAHAPPQVTGQFLSGLILVRIPLFLYTAASATLLPGLAGAAGRHDWARFRQQLDHLVLAIGALAVTTIFLATTVGPAALALVFGQSYRLDRTTMLALAVATSTLLLTTTLSVALTATGAVRYLFCSWSAGIAALILPLVVIHPLFVRVETGLIAGAGVSSAAMLLAIYGRAAPRHTISLAPSREVAT